MKHLLACLLIVFLPTYQNAMQRAGVSARGQARLGQVRSGQGRVVQIPSNAGTAQPVSAQSLDDIESSALLAEPAKKSGPIMNEPASTASQSTPKKQPEKNDMPIKDIYFSDDATQYPEYFWLSNSLVLPKGITLEVPSVEPFPVAWRGKQFVFKTVEAAYQLTNFLPLSDQNALKDVADKLQAAKTGLEARATAQQLKQQYKVPAQQEGNREQLAVMLELIIQKFAQYPDLANMLKKTGTASIKYQSNDFWGVKADGSGHNLLGQMLERVRDEFNKGQAVQPQPDPKKTGAAHPAVIDFDNKKPEFAFLSNYYPLPQGIAITFPKVNSIPLALQGKSVTFKTLESAFLVGKFVMAQVPNLNEIIAALSQEASPDTARNISNGYLRKHSVLIKKSVWQSAAQQWMYFVVKTKFLQYPQLADLLKKTNGTPLRYRHVDTVWGTGTKGDGQNILGALLMKIRDEMRKP